MWQANKSENDPTKKIVDTFKNLQCRYKSNFLCKTFNFKVIACK